MKPTLSRLTLALALTLATTASHAFVFAVNEGVTYRVTNDEIRAKYAAIAADLSKILKAPVTVEPISSYSILKEGLAEKAYDLALVHPAHISIAAMKNDGYRLVAVTKGFEQYRASFLVNADSPLNTLADLKGSSLGAPDADSITAWIVRATIRDAMGDANKVNYSYTRYQDAVPFFVENNLTKAGATASSATIKGWKAKGGKVVFESRPVPIKHIIASASISDAQVRAVREYFVTLDATDEGKQKLAATKWKGFAAYDQKSLMALGEWLGI
ncbi:MAG: PhnD/SsuA/transferrin family substrate-binding protein [Burkholderiales bacterium]